MAKNVTVKKTTTSRVFYKPFYFQGNINGCKVKKFNVNYGDGDIGNDSDSTTYCSAQANLTFNPSTMRVCLTMRYMVWEPDYRKKSNRDCLYFDAVQYYDVSDFVREGTWSRKEKDGTVEIKSTQLSCNFRVVPNEAYISYVVKGKGRNYEHPSRLNGTNRPQSWLPGADFKVRVDGSGKELTEAGNIGVKGFVRFSLVRTDQVVTTTTTTEVSSATLLAPTKGTETKITKFAPAVNGVLGAGYDITQLYADASSCKANVFDYMKLNEYCRLRKVNSLSSNFESFAGEGREEYTKSIEKSLSVKVAAGAYGASFSNETSKTFKEDTETKSSYKFVTQRNVFVHESYYVPSYGVPKQLTGFLTSEFLSDLRKMPANELIDKYGTHVVLGICVGTRLFFNMSYQESSNRKSTASTFSNTTKVSYNADGGVDKSGASKDKSVAQNVYEDLKEGNLSAAELKAYAEYMKVAKNTTPEKAIKNHDDGKTPTLGVSATVSYSENTASTSLKEDKSTKINCTGLGGDPAKLAILTRENDLARYDAWAASWNENNYVFCDFVPGTLIPIYEIIPAGYGLSAQQVKAASEAYQIKKNRRSVPSSKGLTRSRFNTQGNDMNTIRLNDKDGDLYTKPGRETWWRLTVDLLNFDNGRCGFGISFIVKEGGKNGTQTALQNCQTYDLSIENSCVQMAIDSDRLNGKTHYEAEGSVWGEHHEWIDVTEVVKSGVGAVIDCDASRVYIRVDGSGEDLSHVGVQGYAKIPWIGF